MDENQHKAKKIILRILGAILFIVGLSLAIFGVIDMRKSFAEGRMSNFWVFFIGFPSITIGLFMFIVSMQNSINRFAKNQSVHIINEMGKEIAPTMSSMAGAMQNAINQVACPACGTPNEKDALFCKSCGRVLAIKCQECGTINDADAKYCNSCGNVLQ